MKTKTIYIFFIAAMIIAACKPENKPGDDPSRQVAETLEITARNSFKWNKADKVSIFDGKSNNLFRSQGAGESAVLAGEAIHAKVLYGLTPYDSEATLSEAVISASIPENQTVASAVYPNIAVAKTEDINSMEFTPIAGFVKIEIADDAEGVTAVKVTSTGGETIAGAVTVDMSSTKAKVTPASTTATISATAFEGAFKIGSAYYIAVLPGTYKEGITIFYTIKDETYEMPVIGPLTVNVGEALSLGKIERPLSPNEKMFLGEWQVSKWGSRAFDDPTGQYAWISANKGIPLPETSKDDIITFNADGSLKINLGADGKAYNVAAETAVGVELTGKETWTLVEAEDGALTLKLSGNAFPIFLGDWNGLTTDYSVRSLTSSEICLEYSQPANSAYFQVYLQPKGVETSFHAFGIGDFGLNAAVEEEMDTHSGAAKEGSINWYLTTEMGQELFIWKAWGGLQIGAGWHKNADFHVKSMSLSTKDVPGTVKSVSVTTSYSDEKNAAKAELSVKIGGVSFGTKKTLVNDMTKYTFNDSITASGEIIITWKSLSDKLSYFIRDVEVVYQK